MFSFGLGLSTLLVFVAVGSGMAKHLPSEGSWLSQIKYHSGFMTMMLGASFLQSLGEPKLTVVCFSICGIMWSAFTLFAPLHSATRDGIHYMHGVRATSTVHISLCLLLSAISALGLKHQSLALVAAVFGSIASALSLTVPSILVLWPQVHAAATPELGDGLAAPMTSRVEVTRRRRFWQASCVLYTMSTILSLLSIGSQAMKLFATTKPTDTGVFPFRHWVIVVLDVCCLVLAVRAARQAFVHSKAPSNTGDSAAAESSDMEIDVRQAVNLRRIIVGVVRLSPFALLVIPLVSYAALSFSITGRFWWWPPQSLLRTAPPSEFSGIPWMHAQISDAVQLATASGNARPIFVEFHAKWCAACRNMQYTTLADPQVASSMLSDRYVPLSLDCTLGNGPEQALKTHWNIRGMPAYVFISTQQLMTLGGNNASSTASLLRPNLVLTYHKTVQQMVEALNSVAQQHPTESSHHEKEQSGFSHALQQGLLMAVAKCYCWGLLAAMTPCVYPMIPTTVALFSQLPAASGQNGDLDGATETTRFCQVRSGVRCGSQGPALPVACRPFRQGLWPAVKALCCA